jgi:two-component system cell cycle sensor histidine kinase/response regulator CckA
MCRIEKAMIAEDVLEKPTVLVVDDEPMITTILTAILSKAGYPVLAATGPREALQICLKPESQIALAIVDYIMPEQNGAELACSLKEIHPGMRIVMMSGYTGASLRLGDVPCEFHGFLAKPFKVEAAVACVEEALA